MEVYTQVGRLLSREWHLPDNRGSEVLGVGAFWPRQHFLMMAGRASDSWARDFRFGAKFHVDFRPAELRSTIYR